MKRMLRDEAETRAFGLELAGRASAGTVIALVGELGTGKTCLTAAIAEGLGVTAPVTSPTFALIHEYAGGRLPLYHFDVYRLAGPEDLYELGFEEYFYGNGVTVVEWADRVSDLLPEDAVVVRLEYAAGGGRLAFYAPSGIPPEKPEDGVREAEPGDARAMAELDKRCFSVPWNLEDFIYEITENDLALYLVLTEGGRVIGYAGLWVVLREGHITNLAVHPDCRRQGFGARLLDALIQWAADLGAEDFTLEVRESNRAAVRMYERFGFREEGRRKNYYANPVEDAVIMWRHGVIQK
ncbi:MAG: ribosomal protein S18-alanine N-acetyltransferase [Clostridiales Family XIII bacterium]|jgi:ribosomal-protein-alanine acetyltransferase/tRNA threonylcarbamoyl adenosine modification protein YjeE|nr:ribosomal protein S18-alanine N-acetyltransferase [Clostridiales Family XIII bacterium]